MQPPTLENTLQQLRNPGLFPAQRRLLERRAKDLETIDRIKRQNAADRRGERSLQLQEQGADLSKKRFDLTTQPLRDQQAAVEASKRDAATKSQWNKQLGLRATNLGQMLSGSAPDAWKAVPDEHKDYFLYGRAIAGGRKLVDASGGEQFDLEYSKWARAKLKKAYDLYLGTVEGGGTTGTQSSWAGVNLFKTGGVDEGGFIDFAQHYTKFHPLLIGSWMRHELSNRDFKKGVEGTDAYLSHAPELDSYFNQADYDKAVWAARNSPRRRAAATAWTATDIPEVSLPSPYPPDDPDLMSLRDALRKVRAGR